LSYCPLNSLRCTRSLLKREALRVRGPLARTTSFPCGRYVCDRSGSTCSVPAARSSFSCSLSCCSCDACTRCTPKK